MTKEEVTFILEHNISSEQVKTLKKLASKTPFSPFDNRPIEEIRKATIDWVYEQINENE